MRRRTVVTLAGGAVAAGSLAASTAAVLRDPHRRARAARTARVWRLTARRGSHWVAVKVRGAAADAERRAALDHQFAVRTAEDVARELGHMKGAIMKLGQLVSFVAEGLPPEAQQALAVLQADVPPMAPSLAEQVVREELGADPLEVFLDWEPVPVAAASVGQVHRAVLWDGRVVAVKVQYPGVDRAIRSDLDNAELLYGMVAALKLRGLDARALVDELRARMADELDYHAEATAQAAFAERYRDHPFISVPDVVWTHSARRVLTTEWADGMTWAEFSATAGPEARQRAAEAIFRFAQAGVHRHGVFNGDPHPGNYRFARDGSVTFLDFGLVKRWAPGEWESLAPSLDAILAGDGPALVAAMEHAGFLRPGHGLDPAAVLDYVGAPYEPYRHERFTFTREWLAGVLSRLTAVEPPSAEVLARLNMPPSFLILNRVVFGVSALLGKLGATGPWRAILDEYRFDAAPATDLGAEEAAWRAARAATRSG